jgi:hypothetical protein
MSNKFLGYAILAPIILGLIALLSISFSADLLSLVDEQIFITIFIILTISLLIGSLRLLWVPNRKKQWLPISNRMLFVVAVIISIAAATSERFDFGSQLETLLGLLSFIIFFSISFRLITAPQDGETEQSVNWQKEAKNLFIVCVSIIVILATLVFLSPTTPATDNQLTESNDEKSIDEMIGTPLTETELVSAVEDFLSIYQKLYYISLDESADAETATAIVSAFLSEAMSDNNKLDDLKTEVIPLTEKPNLMVSATAMSILGGINQIYNANNNFISYLRTVNPDRADIAEFQYQFSLLGTETKDAYLLMAEGASSMNLAFFEINSDGENVSGDVLIGVQSRQQLLDEIDRLFADIFEEHKAWSEQTGSTNAVVYIIESWRSWIDELGPTKP